MGRPQPLLETLFGELVCRVFAGPLRIRDRALLGYLAAMLAEFAHRDRLYRLRDLEHRPLESIAEMLLEGDLLLRADSFAREREVHKHVGDFALFVTGLWPEWYDRIRRSGGADTLLDYRAVGKRSYYVASTFRHEPYREEAAVLQRLSCEFELCEFGLSLVRQEMDSLGTRPEGLA